MVYEPKLYRGYTYLMRNDYNNTMRVIVKLNNVMIAKKILVVPDGRPYNKTYFGWMRFLKPLPLWEAMEAGLVPLFNMYRNDAS